MKQMFVFENVLTDYTSGMVIVVASDHEECDRMLHKQFGGMMQQDEDGWNNPTIYPMPDNVESGVKHECWGGA